MTLLLLFAEFCKIGLFAVGGGLATMPFLYELAEKYDWFTTTQLVDMIAISESTPGPIGINMATFAGYHAAGVVGAVVASLGIVMPSLVLILAIAKVMDKFRANWYVNAAFYGLRAAAAALIASAGLDIVQIAMLNAGGSFADPLGWLNWKALLLFAVILFLLLRYKKHPVLYIALAAAIGVVFPI